MKIKLEIQKWHTSLLIMSFILATNGIIKAQNLVLHKPVYADKVLPINKADKMFQLVSDSTILFNSGPFVTDSGGGPDGTNLSVLQNLTLEMNYPGFGAGVIQNKRIADDFEVSGYWRVSSIEFYVYQTGSSENSTINHINLRIWDGPPDNLESEIIWGDDHTNVLSSTSWTNSYRVSESMPIIANRPIMAVKVHLPDFIFTTGTYWLDVQFGGTLSTEPSIVPVTMIDSVSTGNAKQLISGFWEDIVDIGEQGIPFTIKGELVDCNPPTSLTGQPEYFGEGVYGAEICWNRISEGYFNQWFYYDDGVNIDGVGGQASFRWAVKFDPQQLEDCEGASLTKIKIYNRSEVANELRIYEGTDAATLLHTQILNGLAVEAWSDVNLTSSVAIDITKQLWIAVFTEDGLQSPAACGNGMNEPNGDLISMDGSNWEHLTDFGMDYTWNLRGFVTTITGETLCLPSYSGNVINQSTPLQSLGFSEFEPSEPSIFQNLKNDRPLNSFNIYRKDESISNEYVLLVNVPALEGTTHYCYVDMDVYRHK
jgi:hypothetical protein